MIDLSRNRRALVGVAFVVVVVAVLVQRGRRVNSWDLVNHPPGPGLIVCFGDSLVAGVGAESEDRSYPAWLDGLLAGEVVASGVPGETAEEGLLRLLRTSQIRGGVVVVTLGGNDILQRTPWEATRESLAAVFEELQERGCLVAFTSLHIAFDGGRHDGYLELCRESGVVYVSDVLGGIVNRPALKADTIHPNGDGYRLLAERVAEVLRPFVE